MNVITLDRNIVEKYRFPVSVDDILRLTDKLHGKVAPDDPAVMELVDTITRDLSDNSSDILVLRAIFDYVQRNWTYVEESENFGRISSASEIIKRGLKGGSADYSVVMVSLLEAAGFKTRIVFGCDVEEEICRACPEVFVGTEREAKQILAELSETFHDRIYYTLDPKSGYWLSLDLWGDHIGGKPSVDRVYLIIYPVEKRWEVVTG